MWGVDGWYELRSGLTVQTLCFLSTHSAKYSWGPNSGSWYSLIFCCLLFIFLFDFFSVNPHTRISAIILIKQIFTQYLGDCGGTHRTLSSAPPPPLLLCKRPRRSPGVFIGRCCEWGRGGGRGGEETDGFLGAPQISWIHGPPARLRPD